MSQENVEMVLTELRVLASQTLFGPQNVVRPIGRVRWRRYQT